jgi:hypothetical protein
MNKGRVMNTLSSIFSLAVILLLTASCGSDSSSAAGGASCTDCITGSFSDSAVTDFEQTSNIAKSDSATKKIMNFVLSEAYAATNGQIRCLENDSVDFRMTALGTETVNVSTSCTTLEEITLGIRIALVESMKTSGKTLRLEYGESGLVAGKVMDMNDFVWGSPFVVPNGKPAYANCNDIYTFHKTGTYKGRVIIQNDPANVIGAGAGQCNVGGGDEYATGYSTEVAFRFKDGHLEFDTDVSNGINFDSGDLNGNGVNRPANIDYERWVIQ